MMKRSVALGAVIAAVVLIVILQTTTPATIGPLGILVVFVLMYLAIFGGLTFLFYGASRAVAWGGKAVSVKAPVEALSFNRAYYYASVVALAPVIFVGMESVGGVSVYDVILVVMFVVIACVYIAKRS